MDHVLCRCPDVLDDLPAQGRVVRPRDGGRVEDGGGRRRQVPDGTEAGRGGGGDLMGGSRGHATGCGTGGGRMSG